ncbi:hypothetical protein CR162_16905 [Pseudoroseomonas rhizosphaerae]|uniref:Uncharacterized protein n=1 Tax=Teichococcus rhizosphaerae TaxID=1335062 RepID=A0A2C7A8W9_9PROT|nr:hypothetical protein [Pseudoroseomonas rhizosphaerae]PHK93795.1 hypothetical protein CR162_16905 [Pseudoroseomonas rhizosphaerae]
MKTLSRRAAVALPAAIALPAAAATASLDAKLLGACATYRGIMDQIRAVEAQPDPAFGSAESKIRERKLSDLCIRMDDALLSIASIPAATPAGMAAKGDLVLSFLPQACSDFELTADSPEILVALSLAHDAVSLQGRPA